MANEKYIQATTPNPRMPRDVEVSRATGSAFQRPSQFPPQAPPQPQIPPQLQALSQMQDLTTAQLIQLYHAAQQQTLSQLQSQSQPQTLAQPQTLNTAQLVEIYHAERMFLQPLAPPRPRGSTAAQLSRQHHDKRMFSFKFYLFKHTHSLCFSFQKNLELAQCARGNHEKTKRHSVLGNITAVSIYVTLSYYLLTATSSSRFFAQLDFHVYRKLFLVYPGPFHIIFATGTIPKISAQDVDKGSEQKSK